MGLQIEPAEGGQENVEMTDSYELTERLYKTADGEIVREGDERAAVLYKGVGKKIPFEEAKAVGLLDGPADAGSAPDPGDDDTDLSKLKRDQLDKLAGELNIEDADKLDSKADVIEAIKAARVAAAKTDD